MSSQPSPTTARPVLDDPDSATALVTTVAVSGPGQQQEVAESLAAHWESRPWPRELISLTVYTDGDGDSVLVYAQWSSPKAPAQALGDGGNPLPDGLGAVADTVAFRHYRAVRGTAVPEDAPAPQSFPVAFFDTADESAARAWLDGLLESEERSEGEDRAYPGAVAAHLHISLDGTRVLSFSEWLTEEQAVAHITAVWEPVLKEFGGTGSLYRHFRTLRG
ncbi:hypothetical protein C3489_12120 [Streptomyces sp. Ru71]|uniref:hypothetical protein n=1 Tax=Streptomyces sp. Ru71 TaxID=2080746 RepID=UPI000CDDBF52|nr:hypothetical protein [Streptomyces sp. Ru71]POX55055.1 hypothetical protein C3489_12120 [Streptomyces sp. Ru71]